MAEMYTVEFRILGPLQVIAGQRPVPMGGVRQERVLAALLLAASRPVGLTRLAEIAYDDPAPEGLRRRMQNRISSLRALLVEANGKSSTDLVVRRGNGYLLQATREQVDAFVFQELVDRARGVADSGDRVGAARLLRQALALWRGPALDGLDCEALHHQIAGLDDARLTALEDCLGLELATTVNVGPLVAEVRGLVARHPLRQRLVGQLMTALYQDGQQAAALAVYQELAGRLADEHGLDPTPQLRDLQRAILRTDLHPAMLRDTTAHRGPDRPLVVTPTGALEPEGEWYGRLADGNAVTVGCQLPADLPDHVGRGPAISRALAVLGGSGAVEGSRSVVVVFGPGGVGKTALSVHLAHRLRAWYPDGQIMVNLGGRQGESAAVVHRVLLALGVPDLRRLHTDEDRLARYRAVIGSRRILIVLDDAASAEEVRPLVPGSPGSALIVSSRARLTTIPGAEHIELGMLSQRESVELLGRIVGTGRVAADQPAALALVTMCAGLPLALRIAGARLAGHPHWPISRLSRRMRDERRRLDEMSAEGLAVRASLGVGYRSLAPAAQRTLRLLGFLAPPDFAAWLVAALIGESLDSVEDLLEQLVDAWLVEVIDDPARGVARYHMHDLVRLFAQEHAEQDDSPETLHSAVNQVLNAAIEMVEQHGERLPGPVPRLYRGSWLLAGLADTAPAAARQSTVLDTEAVCLVSVVERAAALGMHEGAAILADALVYAQFALHNNFDCWNRAHRAALAAARANGNHAAEAAIECGTGLLRYQEDRSAEAAAHFTTAIRLFEAAGNELGVAAARSGLGTVLRELGQHLTALPLLEQALQSLQRVNDIDGAAHAAYGLGYAHRELGNDDVARRYLEHAASLYRSLAHWRGEAIAIRGIGLVFRARGELDQADVWCRRAHDLVLTHGDPHLECYTIQALAKLWIRRGDDENAKQPLERGIATCHELHDRFGVALLRRTLGEMHLAAGNTRTALRELKLARKDWQDLDNELGQARTLRDIGAAYAMEADCAAAHDAWRSAMGTFVRLHTREASELPTWRSQWGCRCHPSSIEPARTDSSATLKSPVGPNV